MKYFWKFRDSIETKLKIQYLEYQNHYFEDQNETLPEVWGLVVQFTLNFYPFEEI